MAIFAIFRLWRDKSGGSLVRGAFTSSMARGKASHKPGGIPWQRNRKPAKSRFSLIYDLVRLIPEGRVASYGQIARFMEHCTPRMVGFAMAAVPHESDVPWHRVINSKGMISVRSEGDGARIQRVLLEAEGVWFDKTGRVDLGEIGWEGPGDSNPVTPGLSGNRR